MRLLLVGSSHCIGPWTAALAQHSVVLAPAPDAAEALRELRGQAALGVLIADDGAGFALRVLRLLRGSGAGVVMVISDSPRAGQRAGWLDDGADDVVAPHCDPVELLARVQAVQRRGGRQEAGGLGLGDAELDVSGHSLCVEGERFALTRMEFALLRLMFVRKGAVMHKAALVDQLHQQGHEADPRAIDVLVCKLRKKLGDRGWLIGTVWGSGYRLQGHRPDRHAA